MRREARTRRTFLRPGSCALIARHDPRRCPHNHPPRRRAQAPATTGAKEKTNFFYLVSQDWSGSNACRCRVEFAGKIVKQLFVARLEACRWKIDGTCKVRVVSMMGWWRWWWSVAAVSIFSGGKEGLVCFEINLAAAGRGLGEAATPPFVDRTNLGEFPSAFQPVENTFAPILPILSLGCNFPLRTNFALFIIPSKKPHTTRERVLLKRKTRVVVEEEVESGECVASLSHHSRNHAVSPFLEPPTQ